MKNLIQSTTEFAMNTVRSYVEEFLKSNIHPIIAIDATCGNGHDTLSLLEAGCDEVYAFDIQDAAIKATALLTADYDNCHLILDSHEDINYYCTDPVHIIVFNLGYLPGGDKALTTDASATIKAVKNGLNMLDVDGLMSITMYSGHSSGAKEKAELLDFASSLDSSIYHVAYINLLNQHRNPPETLFITRKR